MIRPRVMVSSVVRGFEAERESARQAIVDAGGEPVLVNEDLPARSDSSRNVCLDAVASSDIYVCVIGERGGYVAPSGKLVVEEEFEQARSSKLPILLFVRAGDRDEQASALLDKMQDYVSGLFRREFSSPDELAVQIGEALKPVLATFHMLHTDPGAVLNELLLPVESQYTPYLRLVFAPERNEQVVDPRWLGRGDLAQQVLEVAHSSAVGILSFADGTETARSKGWATIQKVTLGRQGEISASVKFSEEGWLVITLAIPTELEGQTHGFSTGMVLSREAIEVLAAGALAFAERYYDLVDLHRRHSILLWNVAIINLGMRSIESNPKPRSSWTGGFNQPNGPVVAYQRAQRITRDGLANPADELDKALFKLESNASDGS